MTSTVILGSGIIGLSAAYYLSQHQPGSTIHLVDSSPELFASASGFAGGFVARDWFQGSVASLGALSFREHERVASEEGGYEKWGYAKTTTVSYQPGVRPRSRRKGGGRENWLEDGGSRAEVVDERSGEEGNGDVPPWLRRSKGDSLDVMDSEGGTAIV
jgi:glycine/D-amino acid oxidase-like deaminating enzyme